MSRCEITKVSYVGQLFEGGSKCNKMCITEVYEDSWDGTPGQCIACHHTDNFPKCVSYCYEFKDEERKAYYDLIGWDSPKVHKIEDLPGRSIYNNKFE